MSLLKLRRFLPRGGEFLGGAYLQKNDLTSFTGAARKANI